jgi:hypothetical protein
MTRSFFYIICHKQVFIDDLMHFDELEPQAFDKKKLVVIHLLHLKALFFAIKKQEISFK